MKAISFTLPNKEQFLLFIESLSSLELKGSTIICREKNRTSVIYFGDCNKAYSALSDIERRVKDLYGTTSVHGAIKIEVLK